MTQRIVIPEPHPELIDPSVFIADGAVVCGMVQLGQDVSVWFNAVLREMLIASPSAIDRTFKMARSCIVILATHAPSAKKSR